MHPTKVSGFLYVDYCYIFKRTYFLKLRSKYSCLKNNNNNNNNPLM